MKRSRDIDKRKLDLLATLRKYGILTTSQLAVLDGGSKQKVSRILHGLRREEQPLFTKRAGENVSCSSSATYPHLNKSWSGTFGEKCGITRGKIDWSQKNAELKGYYKHRLFTQTVRVLLEAHTRNHKDISCIEQYDLLPTLGVSEITWTILGRGRPASYSFPLSE